jgi:hypothetical protein
MFGIGPLPYKELYSRDERSAYEPHQCSPHYVRSHASNASRLASYSIFGASPIRPILGHRPKMVARFLVFCGAIAVAMGVGLYHDILYRKFPFLV